MSESASIAQPGFVNKNRPQSSFSEPVYTRRRVQPVKTRAIRDINSPDYNPWRKSRQLTPNYIGHQSAEVALSSEVTPAEPLPTSSLPVTDEKSGSLKDKARDFFKSKTKLQLSVYVLALLIIASGIYLSLIAWQNNQAVHAQAVKLTAEANKATTSPTGSTTNAISTVKPSPKTVAAYAVAPELPKYLKIPSIGVDAIVGQAGLLANGALGTPSNVYYTDWYTGSSEPGQPGATLIDGHVSSWTADGVFYNLHKLVAGDAIQIVKGDNSVVNYQVVKTQIYSSNNVDMQAAITPVVPGTSGLNLITCTGDVIKGTSQFNQRIIVFAKEI